jgi:aspartyl-tRNA synthetase
LGSCSAATSSATHASPIAPTPAASCAAKDTSARPSASPAGSTASATTAQLLFVDLRDHYGPDPDASLDDLGLSPRFEAVEQTLRLGKCRDHHRQGRRAHRRDHQPKLPTGEIEVAREICHRPVEAENCRCPATCEQDYPRKSASSYRFLDLRRERLHATCAARQGHRQLRRRMIDAGLHRIPDADPDRVLARRRARLSWCRRACIRASSTRCRRRRSMFKQLLMVAGFDRYFQIAPCFRDEDSRADRSPGEFYQLDFEMSFVTQDDVFNAIEPVLPACSRSSPKGRQGDAPPFPRIPIDEAMLKYGSDKPDLRNPLSSPTSPRSSPAPASACSPRSSSGGGVVRAIPAPGAADQAAQLLRQAERLGAEKAPAGPWLCHLRKGGGPAKGPIAKNLGPERVGEDQGRAGPEGRRCACSSSCDKPAGRESFAGARAHQARRGTGPDRAGSVQVLLDRRLPDVRTTTRTPARSSSATTRSRCRRASWKR